MHTGLACFRMHVVVSLEVFPYHVCYIIFLCIRLVLALCVQLDGSV